MALSCCYESKATETRQAMSICAVHIFMPSMCLLDSCWQENHLDRLAHFSYSVACLQVCCLTLSWKWIPKWTCNLHWTSKLIESLLALELDLAALARLQGEPMQIFLFAATRQATWCGTFACSAQGPYKTKNRCTVCLQTLELKSCVFFDRCCFHSVRRRTKKESNQSRRWAGWRPQKCVFCLKKCDPNIAQYLCSE